MKKLVGVCFALGISVVMAGCAAEGSSGWYHGSDLNTKIAYYTRVCQAIGHSPNTEPMKQCIQAELHKGSDALDDHFGLRGVGDSVYGADE